MAKTVQDLARQKEIDDVQEAIQRAIAKIDESLAKERALKKGDKEGA